jgi:hypothetical protein
MGQMDTYFILDLSHFEEKHCRIIESCKTNKKNNVTSYFYPKSWWNNEIKLLHNQKRESLKNYNKIRTLEKFLILRRNETILHRAILKSKKK